MFLFSRCFCNSVQNYVASSKSIDVVLSRHVDLVIGSQQQIPSTRTIVGFGNKNQQNEFCVFKVNQYIFAHYHNTNIIISLYK